MKFVGYQKISKYICFGDKFDNNLSNANFCNFFVNIPQILRVKASIHINLETNLENSLLERVDKNTEIGRPSERNERKYVSKQNYNFNKY